MRTRCFESRWTVVVICTLGLLLAALVPSPLERRPGWERVGPDKLLHLVGHAGYALVLAEALGDSSFSDREAAVLAVCISTTHSLVSGRLQEHVPGRAFELADVVAGLLGSLLAVYRWYTVNAESTVDDTG